MAKINFTLHGVAAEIRRAEKKLRALRSKVSKADQKKIDLDLRALEKSYRCIRIICPPRPINDLPLFGQRFTTKAK
ncbi:MAG: hypothetical protein WA211_14300 [Candidatus Acidiferrales bacterium]|jgi:hypothetical protein